MTLKYRFHCFAQLTYADFYFQLEKFKNSFLKLVHYSPDFVFQILGKKICDNYKYLIEIMQAVKYKILGLVYL